MVFTPIHNDLPIRYSEEHPSPFSNTVKQAACWYFEVSPRAYDSDFFKTMVEKIPSSRGGKGGCWAKSCPFQL